MARSARDHRLENRTARLKLKASERYVAPIDEGVALVYRRTADGFGVWWVRQYHQDVAKYSMKRLGAADDFAEADGLDVFTYHQAQTKARQMVREARGQGSKVSAAMTVEGAAQVYLDWFREHRKGVTVTESIIRSHILPTLGSRLVRDLKASEIRAWLEKLAASPRRLRTGMGQEQRFASKAAGSDAKRARKATANRGLTVLKAILNRAFQNDMVPDDLAWRRVKPFENADEPIVRFLEPDEMRRLLNACEPSFRELVKGALLTGARFSELCRIRVKDVKLDLEMVYVTPSKSGKGRHVALSSEGVAFFERLTVGRDGVEPVFVKDDGTPWKDQHQKRPMTEAVTKAKIEPRVTFHDLRHTYASSLVQNGVDLLTVSKLLGHADTRITQRHYAHLADRHLAAGARKLPELGGEKPGNVSRIKRA